jgi:topoisomerase-4 subunit A
MIHIEKWVPDRPISTVYFDGEKELHYVKRFVCEVHSDKRVLFISESAGSYMDAVSTAYRPEVKIVYNKLLKETKNLPDNVMNLADMIDVKGMKAQGNQITKLKVKEIVLTHPIDEGKESWPEDEAIITTDEIDVEIDSDEGDAPTVEWDLTKKPEEDDEDQMKLF